MKPNIVLIVTDDQPRGLLDAMSITRALLRDKGCVFPTGIITTPLCGPSRSSILTGQWAHSHGVWQNTADLDGGWRKLADNEDITIATAVHQAGYRTALFGKYMNGWARFSHQVPPGWDEFGAIVPDDGGDGDYYNYTLAGTVNEHYGDTVYDYSTDVIRQHAEAFIHSVPDAQPLFLYFSPYGAHGKFIPANRHVGTWPAEPLPPSVNDSNADRVPFMQTLKPVDEAEAQETIRRQHEVVMSIDDAVGGIITALGDRAKDTLFLFTGDNGLQRGDHRLNGKNVPYQGALNVQMIMRWDGHVTPDSKDKEPVTNEDIAATVVDAAGATLLGCEGQSMLRATTRPGVYVEGSTQGDNVPGWVGWRTRRYLYINWGTGQGEELYDYDDDRWELVNLAAVDKPPKVLTSLRTRTLQAGHQFPPHFTPFIA